MSFTVKEEGRGGFIVLLWRRWHRVPEVDRVFVCVLSTPALQAPPPKRDKRAVVSPHSVVANGIC